MQKRESKRKKAKTVTQKKARTVLNIKKRYFYVDFYSQKCEQCHIKIKIVSRI